MAKMAKKIYLAIAANFANLANYLCGDAFRPSLLS
jgi:hypothetical protein